MGGGGGGGGGEPRGRQRENQQKNKNKLGIKIKLGLIRFAPTKSEIMKIKGDRNSLSRWAQALGRWGAKTLFQTFYD